MRLVSTATHDDQPQMGQCSGMRRRRSDSVGLRLIPGAPGWGQNRMPRQVAAGCLSAVVSGAAYTGFLAWDTQYYLGADGTLHGPYQAWQVIGVVLVLAIVGFVSGLRAVWVPVVVAATVVVTVGFSISGATSPQNDGLWPVGSMLVLIGTAAGMSLLAALGSALVALNKRRNGLVWTPPPSWPRPPTGWEPYPSWRPDPSWPAAPARWPWWQELDRNERLLPSKMNTARTTASSCRSERHLAPN
jgi:hypothetical protein